MRTCTSSATGMIRLHFFLRVPVTVCIPNQCAKEDFKTRTLCSQPLYQILSRMGLTENCNLELLRKRVCLLGGQATGLQEKEQFTMACCKTFASLILTGMRDYTQSALAMGQQLMKSSDCFLWCQYSCLRSNA